MQDIDTWENEGGPPAPEPKPTPKPKPKAWYEYLLWYRIGNGEFDCQGSGH